MSAAIAPYPDVDFDELWPDVAPSATGKPSRVDKWIAAHQPQQPRGIRTTHPPDDENTAIGFQPIAGLCIVPGPSGDAVRVSEFQSADAFAPPTVAPVYQRPARNVSDFSSRLSKRDKLADQDTRWERLIEARKIMYGTKMATCMVYPRAPGSAAVVDHNGCPGFCGFKCCRNRLCPWCAEKLAQSDYRWARKFILGWVKRGNAICQVAFTLRHTRAEPADAVWDAHTKVLDSCHSGIRWRKIAEEFGLLEHIYKNEIMLGDNGCHKHQHRDWEVKMRPELKTRQGRRAFQARLQKAYLAQYMWALGKHGRSALPKFALKLTVAAPTAANASKAASYVTKFAKETTQGQFKTSAKGNYSMWDLVDIGRDGTASPARRTWARDLFRDTTEALARKRWVFCSERLAKDTGVGESEIPEDDDEMDDPGTVMIPLADLTCAMLHDQRKHAYLLRLCKEQGYAAASEWLRDFTNPQNWSHEWLVKHRHDGQGSAPPVHCPEWGEEGF